MGIRDKNGPAPVGSMIGRRATRTPLSDATVLAGWRPPPRVITDLADPAGVSDCTVVLDVLGVSGQRAGTSGWFIAAQGASAGHHASVSTRIESRLPFASPGWSKRRSIQGERQCSREWGGRW